LHWGIAAREAVPPGAQAALAAPKQPAALPPAADELDGQLDVAEQLEAIAAFEAENARAGERSLSPAQLRRLQAYGASQYKLLSERLAATRELLERAPDERYALELFVTDNPEPARMERFLLRARDMVPLSDVYLIPMGPGSPRMRVVYGAFDSERQAEEAERRLPPKYQQAFRTAPRSFAELRKQM